MIELMVTVAVISILASVAYPAYTDYVVKTNRSAVQSFMFGVANKQEQYLLDARSYTSTLTNLYAATPAEVSRNYSVTLENVGAAPPTYTIRATPTGSQAQRDTRCNVLTLNQAGVKTKSGAGTLAECW